MLHKLYILHFFLLHNILELMYLLNAIIDHILCDILYESRITSLIFAGFLIKLDQKHYYKPVIDI